MAKIKLVFKGGAVVDLDVEKFTVTRSGLGGITGVSWKSGKDNPLTIEPDELAAVIERTK